MTQQDWLAWLSAIGTVGAAAVPLVFFLIERRDRLRAEQRQLEAERAQRIAERAQIEAEERFRSRQLEAEERFRSRQLQHMEQEQAELVHAWTQRADKERIVFSNRSMMPITDVSAEVQLNYSSKSGGHLRVARLEVIKVMPPTGPEHDLRVFEDLLDFSDKFPRGDAVLSTWELVGLRFTDTHGRRWRRDLLAGGLTRGDDVARQDRAIAEVRVDR